MWKWISLFAMPYSAFCQVNIEWEQDLSAQELEQLQDQLTELRNNPLALNSASIYELSGHPLITMNEAISIKRYIDESGALLDWGELCEAHGISAEWIEARKEFLKLNEDDHITVNIKGQRKLKASVGFAFDNPRKAGYLEDNYLGVPVQVQGKVEYKAYPYSFFWRWQQDAGEPFQKIQSGLVDHHSFNLQWTGGRSWNVSIGDYRLGHSTGVLFGSGFGSAIPQSANQLHTYFNPNSPVATASEIGSYRGIMIRFKKNLWKLQLNGGYSNVDATLNNGFVASYPSTGNHRTEIELRRKNAVVNRHASIFLEKTWQAVRLSWSSHLFNFEKTINPFVHAHSITAQLIHGTHFMDTEIAFDHVNRIASGLSYSKSIGDFNVGLKMRLSSLGFQPATSSAQGLLFSGGGERSGILLCSQKWKSNTLTASIYHGIQRKPDWKSSLSKGWQIEYQYQKRAFTAGSRLRRRESEKSGSLYLRNLLKLNIDPVIVGFRTDHHWQSLSDGTSLIALTAEYRTVNMKIRTDVFIHQADKAALPVWLMMRTTSMQMNVQRFSATGAGLNVYVAANLTSALKIEVRSMAHHLLHAEHRGSGLDESPGGIAWAFNIELHYQL
ncbi:MAG: hypothetical protein HWE14_01800 [Flavobacteriia bacterium]|nr:hypothetical protein [Flavobacteriia bacterium]